MGEQAASLLSALVDNLQTTGVLTQPAVEAAFRAVPRHLFLPQLPIEEVYRDEAIPIKMQDGRAISSSSQPAIMAIMLEQLDLAPGQRVLEIGAGTGYNAALLGWLVGPNGQVTTVDIDDDLVAGARAHLTTAGSGNVQVVQADGGEGYAPAAPYDRIVLTVGAWDITPAWLEQLRPGGRLVLPLRVGNGAQRAVAFVRAPPGREPRLVSQSARDCGFMVLRGAFSGPEVVSALGPTPGLTLTTPGPMHVPGERVYQWLMAGAERRGTGLQTTEGEVFGSLSLWLDLHETQMASLTIEGVAPPPGGWPCLFRTRSDPPNCFTFQLLTPEGMAVLDSHDQTAGNAGKTAGELGPFELKMMAYGPQGSRVAQDMLALLRDWDKAGRPSSERLRLRVYGADYPVTVGPGEVLVQKRWTRTLVDWPT